MEPKQITYPSAHPDGDAMGLLYGTPGPEVKGLVFVHDRWGVESQIKDMAADVQEGKCGFAVLVADVFRGKEFTKGNEARDYINKLDYPQAAMDVAAAAKYLKEQGCLKVGVIGYGFGGSLALVAAALHASDDVIDAVSPHCGVPKPALADLTKITCPVQGHYAAKDKTVGVASPADFNPMSELLWNSGVNLEMCIYDAGHAFVNPSYHMYNKEKTEEYFANLFRFLDEQLGIKD